MDRKRTPPGRLRHRPIHASLLLRRARGWVKLLQPINDAATNPEPEPSKAGGRTAGAERAPSWILHLLSPSKAAGRPPPPLPSPIHPSPASRVRARDRSLSASAPRSAEIHVLGRLGSPGPQGMDAAGVYAWTGAMPMFFSSRPWRRGCGGFPRDRCSCLLQMFADHRGFGVPAIGGAGCGRLGCSVLVSLADQLQCSCSVWTTLSGLCFLLVSWSKLVLVD